MDDIFFLIKDNGKSIKLKSLEEIINFSSSEFILKASFSHKHVTPAGFTFNYYKYSFVDEKGKNCMLKIGNIFCFEGGVEDRYYRDECTISPIIRNAVGKELKLKYFTTAGGWQNDIKKFVSDLNKINTVGLDYWEIYLEKKELELEIKKLKDDLEDVKKDKSFLLKKINDFENIHANIEKIIKETKSGLQKGIVIRNYKH